MKIGLYIKRAFLLLLVMTVLCGGIYTLAVTGIAQLLFPYQSNGSIMVADNKAVGSELIGQYFSDPKYFWGRPSASADYPYNVLGTSGSNKDVTSADTEERIKQRTDYIKAADPDNDQPVPVELVTASASGVDPDISPAAARYQAGRIAKARGISIYKVYDLIDKNIQGRFLGIFGEERVNVLKINIALDNMS